MKTKAKKIPREHFLTRLNILASDVDFVKKNVDVGEAKKYVTLTSIMQKGERVTACFCHDCGTKYNVNENFYSYVTNTSTFKCPVCGNSEIISRPGKCDRHSSGKHHKLIFKTDNGFEFVNFNTYDMFTSVSDWYNHDAEVGIYISSAGIFDRYNGIFIASNTYEGKYKVIRKNSSDESSILFWLKDYTDSNVSDEECQALLNEAKQYHQAQEELAKERSNKRKAKKEEEERLEREAAAKAELLKKQEHDRQMLSDPRWQYKAKKISVEQCLSHPIFYQMYSTSVDGDETYLVGCSKCGKTREVVNLDVHGAYTCQCGNHTDRLGDDYFGRSARLSQAAIVFENTPFEENDLLIRVFRSTYYMDLSEGVVKSEYESKRIFAGKDIAIYYRRDEADQFDKDICNELPYFSEEIHLLQNTDEIIKIIQNSCLKYSGLIDSWGLGEYKYNWKTQIPDMRYLNAWYKNPKIEMVMKSNLTHLTEYFVGGPYSEGHTKVLNRDGKTLHEVLNVSSQLLKIARPMNPTYEVLWTMQDVYMTDNTMTREVFEEMAATRLSLKYFKDIAELYGIPYSKSLQYLQTAYDHQCIDKDECLTVWVDYLRMAKAIGIDLSDKAKMFPTSLKKEHDIAVFAYRAVKIEIDQKMFEERAQINKKYEFEDENLMAIIPNSPQEIIEEANAQNNCLRSYVERVRKGETIVVFVRKKDEPDKTYLSAEIYDGRLTQLKGYCNSNPRNKTINDFVLAWSNEKKFEICC